jgi:hypothetical protein
VLDFLNWSRIDLFEYPECFKVCRDERNEAIEDSIDTAKKEVASATRQFAQVLQSILPVRDVSTKRSFRVIPTNEFF